MLWIFEQCPSALLAPYVSFLKWWLPLSMWVLCIPAVPNEYLFIHIVFLRSSTIFSYLRAVRSLLPRPPAHYIKTPYRPRWSFCQCQPDQNVIKCHYSVVHNHKYDAKMMRSHIEECAELPLQDLPGTSVLSKEIWFEYAYDDPGNDDETWVGIWRASAMLCQLRLSSSASKAPCTPDSIRLLA